MSSGYLSLVSCLALLCACGVDFVGEQGAGGKPSQGGGGATTQTTGGAGGVANGGMGGSAATGGSGASGGDMPLGGGGAATGPFQPPTAVTALNDTLGDQDDPTLPSSMLEIFFDSNRPGGMGQGDVWTSTRPDLQSDWSTPVAVATLNSTASETSPEISADGLTIYLSSTRSGSNGQEIYLSKRAAVGGMWSPPVLVGALNTSADEWAATPASDVFLVFNSTQPGHTDMYQATRADALQPWGSVTSLDVNTPANDADPWLNASLTTFHFGSDRDGDFDIFVSVRASAADAWEAPQPVSELNTAGFESDPWLSPDGKIIFFTRDNQIFTATR